MKIHYEKQKCLNQRSSLAFSSTRTRVPITFIGIILNVIKKIMNLRCTREARRVN